MEIVHRLALNVDQKRQAELAKLGIRVELGFAGFDVVESDPNWPNWQVWIEQHRPSDIVRAAFSVKEVQEAPFLSMRAKDQVGYPQPGEDDFGYLQATYDLSDYCPDCGVGARQIAPFQFKSEPRWGHRGMLQLNWVFDEFFVRVGPDADPFRNQGIVTRPVIDRSRHELATVAQLDIGGEVHLDTRRLDAQTCPSCRRTKFRPVVRGELPPFLEEPEVGAVKSSEWFGSGHNAYREVLISKRLRESISRRVARGVSFVPVAPD